MRLQNIVYKQTSDYTEISRCRDKGIDPPNPDAGFFTCKRQRQP
eukprot:UN11698